MNTTFLFSQWILFCGDWHERGSSELCIWWTNHKTKYRIPLHNQSYSHQYIDWKFRSAMAHIQTHVQSFDICNFIRLAWACHNILTDSWIRKKEERFGDFHSCMWADDSIQFVLNVCWSSYGESMHILNFDRISFGHHFYFTNFIKKNLAKLVEQENWNCNRRECI